RTATATCWTTTSSPASTSRPATSSSSARRLRPEGPIYSKQSSGVGSNPTPVFHVRLAPGDRLQPVHVFLPRHVPWTQRGPSSRDLADGLSGGVPLPSPCESPDRALEHCLHIIVGVELVSTRIRPRPCCRVETSSTLRSLSGRTIHCHLRSAREKRTP